MLCPTVGFGSSIFPTPDETSWLDINLPEPRPIDTVVLIPALLKNSSGELETLGFPHRFTIETWRDPSPARQSVKLENGGWLYQSIGTYDESHPDELICDLTLNQSLIGAGAATVTLTLYYASDFAPADGTDIQKAPNAVQVGASQTLEPWSDWAAKVHKQSSRTIRTHFDLSTVPTGMELYLHIANHTPIKNAIIDEVSVNEPFNLNNRDFETPRIPHRGIFHNIVDWYDAQDEWIAVQQSTYQSGVDYRSGGIVVDYSTTDYPNPGAAPVVFELPPGTIAQKVRIRSVRMQQEASWRKKTGHNFAINEVLLFDGAENIALNSETAASDHENFPLMFNSNYAVDGYSYFPPVDPKEVSSPQAELIDDAENSCALLFDLGQSYTLNQASFYPVDRSPQFSHVYAMGIGFPREITLRISDQPNPNTASTVININTLQQIGASPLIRRLPNISGRYVWVEMNEGQRDPRTNQNALGVSEIELFQNGVNVLHGIEPLSSKKVHHHHLTDGLTSSGIVIPEKSWLIDLARRSELEQQKIELAQLKGQLSARQSRLLKRLQFTILLLLVAAIISTLVARSRHRQHLRHLREKIGANLHDEVGANLSSIALSSEILQHSYTLDKTKSQKLLDDINRISRETATEIRLLSRFLEKQDVESNLIGQLRRIEQQMLPSLITRSDYGSPERFNALTAIEKWEIVLFFKEALHNIVKHAEASEVTIRTYEKGGELHLYINDNGKGFNDENPQPVHLSKRAKQLKAQLKIQSSATIGTSIQLSIPNKKFLKK